MAVYISLGGSSDKITQILFNRVRAASVDVVDFKASTICTAKTLKCSAILSLQFEEINSKALADAEINGGCRRQKSKKFKTGSTKINK